jgi:hypothetical protein
VGNAHSVSIRDEQSELQPLQPFLFVHISDHVRVVDEATRRRYTPAVRPAASLALAK